jgi:hypothetical protein
MLGGVRDHEVLQFFLFFLSCFQAWHGAGGAGANAKVNVRDKEVLIFFFEKIYGKNVGQDSPHDRGIPAADTHS